MSALPPNILSARRLGIGGSECAAILGLHPFLSPIDVYLAKVEGYSTPVTADMERGTFMEDGIARWAAYRHGLELEAPGMLVHPQRSVIRCNPDRLFRSAGQPKRLLSIKAPGDFYSEEWGEPHRWQVPTYAYLQLQYEMAIAWALDLCTIDWGYVAAVLGGDLQVLPVAGDSRVQARLMDEVEGWWNTHVEAKNPPPLDGSESAKLWLRRRFPRDETRIVHEATPTEDLLCLALKDAEKACEATDDSYETARRYVEEAIGARGGISGPFGRITFYADKRGRRTLLTNWKGPLP